jgi:hypothetical protein
MEVLISASTAVGNPYFRWFDSGDLQGPEHLAKIIEIAQRLPSIKFWLPTQEYIWIRDVEIPPNLVIRPSATLIDGFAPSEFENSSRIAGEAARNVWTKLAEHSSKAMWYCPGELHETYNCGACRACWDKDTKVVVYIER